MARNVTIDLELLKRIGDTMGKHAILVMFADGSGSIDPHGEADYPHAVYFGSVESPNLAMEAYLTPDPPTLLDDLESVWDDCDDEPENREAFERLSNHLKKETGQ